jgi:hypothetical protein
MEEKTAIVLDARRLVLRQAIAHYQRLNPSSSRVDIVGEVLDESVSLVLEKLKTDSLDFDSGTDETGYLTNLAGYLFGVFKNKLRNFQRKSSERSAVEYPEELSDHGSFADNIDKRILIAEIVARFNPEERFIFDRILLGDTFDKIAKRFSEQFGKTTNAVALRVKFHRAVARIGKGS